jgi:hypothetical protein
MFPTVDGGRSRISSSGTSKGDRRQCFLAWMVGAPGSPAPAPPKGPPSIFFNVDGGCSWISISTRQGGPPSIFLSVDGGRFEISSSCTSNGPHRCYFLMLMVGAPGSPSTPVKGARHRRPLQPRWWPLSDLTTSPPMGLPLTSSSILVVAAAGPTGSAPQWVCHRCLLQPRWWALPDRQRP